MLFRSELWDIYEELLERGASRDRLPIAERDFLVESGKLPQDSIDYDSPFVSAPTRNQPCYDYYTKWSILSKDNVLREYSFLNNEELRRLEVSRPEFVQFLFDAEVAGLCEPMEDSVEYATCGGDEIIVTLHANINGDEDIVAFAVIVEEEDVINDEIVPSGVWSIELLCGNYP